MRPIRVTGVTGTSATVPLDVYCTSPASIVIESASNTAQVQYTLDDVFNAAITPAWINLVTANSTAAAAQAPMGARGVRCTGMVSGDVLAVSQQSVR
jgi:hypothetical protein